MSTMRCCGHPDSKIMGQQSVSCDMCPVTELAMSDHDPPEFAVCSINFAKDQSKLLARLTQLVARLGLRLGVRRFDTRVRHILLLVVVTGERRSTEY